MTKSNRNSICLKNSTPEVSKPEKIQLMVHKKVAKKQRFIQLHKKIGIMVSVKLNLAIDEFLEHLHNFCYLQCEGAEQPVIRKI